MARPRNIENIFQIPEKLLSQFPKRLSDKVFSVIRKLEQEYRAPSETWNILTDIFGRANNLIDGDKENLLLFKALRPVERKLFDNTSELTDVLGHMASPPVEIRPAIASFFALDPEGMTDFLMRLASISYPLAEALPEGRIQTARNLWHAVSRSDQNRIDAVFEEEVAALLRYHLLDSIWEAGRDEARRRLEPTGSRINDGDGSQTLVGSIDKRVHEILSGLRMLKTIAKETDQLRQKEMIELFFELILGLAESVKAMLEAAHGDDLARILDIWMAHINKHSPGMQTIFLPQRRRSMA